MIHAAHVSLSILVFAGCATPQDRSPQGASLDNWRRTSIAAGRGQIHLGVRSGWVVERVRNGVRIKAAVGATALVRVFSCGKPQKYVEALVRKQLGNRMLGTEFTYFDEGKIFAWRWRVAHGVQGAAVAGHGPLLISAESDSFPLADLAEITRRITFTLPVPLLEGCLPDM